MSDPRPGAGARPPLPRSFYETDALRLARRLLGKALVHAAPEGTAACRIVEVEAYRGPEDRAAHSAGGRRTPRNEVMWGPAGHLYVYFVYGMHWCANVVAADVDRPEAVLLRAAEPLDGLDLMRARRARDAGTRRSAGKPGSTRVRRGAPTVRDEHLLRGPANLCTALGIDRGLNGADLLAGPVLLLDGPAVPARSIIRTPRIGVDYAGDDALLPWRLFVAGSPAVSKAAARPARDGRG